jgi:phosphotransferase system enzyme I (PtsI)
VNQPRDGAEYRLEGIAASGGVALGPAYIFSVQDLDIPERPIESPVEEWARFLTARDQALLELNQLGEKIAANGADQEAMIFIAQQEILQDPLFESRVEQEIERGLIVEAAILSTSEGLAAMLAGMDDEMFAARAADVLDIGRRLLRILMGWPVSALEQLETPVIVVADDLTPSDTANLNPAMVLGFCTAQGGLTSHSAILARTLGLPAVVGMGERLLADVQPGVELALDGYGGLLFISPDFSTKDALLARRQRERERMDLLAESTHRDARTASGRRVEVAANVGDLQSTLDAMSNGAEGIGLLRTEFLYLDEHTPPGEEKQIQIYKSIFEIMHGRPVIVRTLDIGGDKPPAYIPFPREMNPFLGWRAIRISLDEISLFKTQIRAILRAGAGHNIRIMFPMVNDYDEMSQSRQVVEQVMEDLTRQGLPFAESVPIGMMVETPAAAVSVDLLAEVSDFFSLGTNDLTQYALAVDRGNSKVQHLYQSLHPGVLRLIHQTIETAHKNGKWVGMCGELAGMPRAIPILLGMGLDEFSMNPRAIPEAKSIIARFDESQAQRITQNCLSMTTARQIEAYMQDVLERL